MNPLPTAAAEPAVGAGAHTDAIAGQIRATASPVAAAVAAWTDNLAALGKRPKTVSSYRSTVQSGINENGWTHLSDLTPASLTGWMDRKSKAGHWKGVTRNRSLAALRSFTKFLAKRRLIEADPLADADRAENDGGEGARAASVPEARALIRYAWAREQTDRRSRSGRWLYWLCLFLTGARVSEPGKWRWRHVHLDAEVPHIHWTKEIQKNRRVQDTALCPELVTALREHRDRMRAAPPADGRPCNPDNPNDFVFPFIPPRCQFRNDREKAGIDTIDNRGRRFSPHSARKAFSTWLRLAGVDGALVTTLMRHTVTVEGRYDDRPLSAQAVAVGLLPRLIPVVGPDNEGGSDLSTFHPPDSDSRDGGCNPIDGGLQCSHPDATHAHSKHSVALPRPGPMASGTGGSARRGATDLGREARAGPPDGEDLSGLLNTRTPILGQVTVDRAELLALLSLAARLLREQGRVQGQSEPDNRATG